LITKELQLLRKKANATFVKKKAIGLILALRSLIPLVTKWKRIFRTLTERLWAICWGRKEIKIRILDDFVQILEAKIGKSFDFVLDSLNFDTNKVNEFSYLRSPVLDSFFDEDSKVFGHCLLIDSYSEKLAKYINAYVKGKSKKTFWD
jgi:hypothetical protein